MLSKNQVVKIKKIIEQWYTDTCNVIVKTKVKKEGITSFEDEVIYSGLKCVLSYVDNNDTSQSDTADYIKKTALLILPPECTIPAGSRIEITKNGIKSEWQRSSEPDIYETHQEIKISLKKEYA